MQILLSDWLSDRTLSAIGMQWLEVVDEMATFFRFFKVFKESFDANGKLNSCAA